MWNVVEGTKIKFQRQPFFESRFVSCIWYETCVDNADCGSIHIFGQYSCFRGRCKLSICECHQHLNNESCEGSCLDKIRVRGESSQHKHSSRNSQMASSWFVSPMSVKGDQYFPHFSLTTFWYTLQASLIHFSFLSSHTQCIAIEYCCFLFCKAWKQFKKAALVIPDYWTYMCRDQASMSTETLHLDCLWKVQTDILFLSSLGSWCKRWAYQWFILA